MYWTASPGTTALMSVAVPPGPTFAPGPPQELFRRDIGTTWDLAPDGERFLLEVLSTSPTGSVVATITDWFDELRRRAASKK